MATADAPAKKGIIQEFKEFLTTGDLMTIAVAFIMGVAVKALIDSFVNDIVMGIIGLMVKCEAILGADGKPTGKKDCTGIAGKAYETVRWGAFINQAVVFVLTALAVFGLVKFYRAATKRDLSTAGPNEVALLTEIRDELRARNG